MPELKTTLLAALWGEQLHDRGFRNSGRAGDKSRCHGVGHPGSVRPLGQNQQILLQLGAV